MRVRNTTGRQILLAAQKKVVRPGIDFLSVQEDDEVGYLLDAGALERDTDSYAAKSPEELQAEADRRGLNVEGTGKDGNVLKADLVAALEAHDQAGNPPQTTAPVGDDQTSDSEETP